MKRFLFILPLFGILFSACIHRELGPAEYMSWVKNGGNGLRVTKEVGKHTFVLQYKPCEYEALLHAKSTAITQQELTAAVKPLKQMQYFTFCIQSSDKKDPAGSVAIDEADYNQRLNYLMFDMQQDFSLIDGADTLPCVFYHYERNYNLSADNNILLGFEMPARDKSLHDKTVIYDDHLLDSGPVLLTVKAKNIESIPSLKLPY